MLIGFGRHRIHVDLLSVGIAMSLCLRRTRGPSELEHAFFVVVRKWLSCPVYDLSSKHSAIFSTENLFAA